MKAERLGFEVAVSRVNSCSPVSTSTHACPRSTLSTLNSRVSTSLNSRVSSSTSSLHRTTTRLYSTTNHLARKHSRVSLLAAGAATVGLVGGACAIADAAPWDQAAGNVATTVHGGSLASSGHIRRSSARRRLVGRRGSSTAKSATASNKAAAPAKAAPAKAAAPAPSPRRPPRPGQPRPAPAANPEPSQPYLMYDSVTAERAPVRPAGRCLRRRPLRRLGVSR